MKKNERPNILIFMTDQQRGDSIYPYSKAIMPNLEHFCKEGITFERAYTIAPHCCPSRATFFSGLYPSQHGVWNNVNVGNTLSRGLYDDVRLFPEDLKKSGYKTYFSGKWHVSDVESPLNRGFDVMHYPKPFRKKILKHEAPRIYEWEDYQHYKVQTTRGEGQIIRNGYFTYTHYGVNENPFNDEDVINDAVNIIHSHKNEAHPWLQYVGTLGPHDPYFLPQKYLDMYDINDIKLPDNFWDKMEDKPGLYRKTRDRFNQLSEQEHKEAIRHYLAFCTYEDALFGKLLNALKDIGEEKNTLVLYISDHGDYMSEHGLWCKGLPCFNGAYHIPVALRWPEGIAGSGRTVHDFITLADIAPTLLEICDIPVQGRLSGYSLVPYLIGKTPEIVQTAHFTQSNGNELYGIQRSITTEEWKYVYNGFDYDELYDLINDPAEKKNLISEKQNSEIIRELSKQLWTFAKRVGDVCVNQYIMVALAEYGPGILYETEV